MRRVVDAVEPAACSCGRAGSWLQGECAPRLLASGILSRAQTAVQAMSDGGIGVHGLAARSSGSPNLSAKVVMGSRIGVLLSSHQGGDRMLSLTSAVRPAAVASTYCWLCLVSRTYGKRLLYRQHCLLQLLQ